MRESCALGRGKVSPKTELAPRREEVGQAPVKAKGSAHFFFNSICVVLYCTSKPLGSEVWRKLLL
jgi:hypothetical protein